MKEVFTVFNIKKGDLVSISGSGGKTHLMFQLAYEIESGDGCVITSVSTKMQPLISKFCKNVFIAGFSAGMKDKPFPFITGGIEPETCKFLSPPLDMLKNKFADYNKNFSPVIFEADGSRGKPLKFYEDYEPVLTGYETKKIIVMGFGKVFKKKISMYNTHRLSKFGNFEGNLIDEFTLSDLLLREKGYIDSAKAYTGDVSIVFSSISKEGQIKKLKNIAAIVKEKYPHINFFAKGKLFGCFGQIFHNIVKLETL